MKKSTVHRRTAARTGAACGIILLALFAFARQGYAFWDEAHKGTAMDAIAYMENSGTNQQRWAADFLKARAGGRSTGSPSINPNNGNGVQYGLLGMARAGAVLPDYLQDLWWDDTTTWNWCFEIAGYQINFSSWTHFMNLLKNNAEGTPLVAGNYNDFDGYSYNGAYGYDDGISIDYVVASWMNNAWMTVDLPNCTECGGSYTAVPGANPAVDYRQNGSSTPVGAPGNGGYRSGVQDRTNYNCFSDSFSQDCPDVGTEVNGMYQVPNTGDDSSFWSGDEDWVIFEPLDNAAVFYYNEWFLEGGASSSGSSRHSLQEWAVTGRYYTMPSFDLNYLAIIMHYAGDANALVHIWVTTGYNHSDYEEWIDDNYAGLVDPAKVTSCVNSRFNRWGQPVDHVLTENAFITYNARSLAGRDMMTNSDDATYRNCATDAVNQAVASIVILYEKGVMDLRKHRI
ncbi:MAG: hypothetical protein KBA61_10020 [Spirochaetes bacterium]|nr:hypothetical protein [Spirochaetota bacterium]